MTMTMGRKGQGANVAIIRRLRKEKGQWQLPRLRMLKVAPLLLSFHKVAGTFGKSHSAIMGIIPIIQVSLERKKEDDGGERENEG